MSYESWHVGMKVVFVGYPGGRAVTTGNGRRINRHEWVKVGGVYTILEIAARDHFKSSRWAGVPSIYVGFDDPKYGGVWHHCSGFRPVQARSTDISVFTAMLQDERASEQVTA